MESMSSSSSPRTSKGSPRLSSRCSTIKVGGCVWERRIDVALQSSSLPRSRGTTSMSSTPSSRADADRPTSVTRDTTSGKIRRRRRVLGERRSVLRRRWCRRRSRAPVRLHRPSPRDGRLSRSTRRRPGGHEAHARGGRGATTSAGLRRPRAGETEGDRRGPPHGGWTGVHPAPGGHRDGLRRRLCRGLPDGGSCSRHPRTRTS